jgi:hypothetical protein
VREKDRYVVPVSTGSVVATAAAAAAATAVLGVAGCANPAPAGPRSLPALPALRAATGASPGAAGSSSPAPPAGLPAGSRIAERAAATAVVRHYYAIANHLPHHMDYRALAAIFTPGCFCRVQVRAVRSAASHGEHYIGWATLNSVVTTIDGPGLADVLVDLNVSRGGLVTSGGRPVTAVPPKRHLKRVFRLEHAGRGWLISAIEEA